jgi:hypothetical protein
MANIPYIVKSKRALAIKKAGECTRTPLTEACGIILRSLKQAGKPVTVSELVRMTELNRKTGQMYGIPTVYTEGIGTQ